MTCKTCNDTKFVYTVAYKVISIPLHVTYESTEPTPRSFALEQVKVVCPDCDRQNFPTEPAPCN